VLLTCDLGTMVVLKGRLQAALSASAEGKAPTDGGDNDSDVGSPGKSCSPDNYEELNSQTQRVLRGNIIHHLQLPQSVLQCPHRVSHISWIQTVQSGT